MPIFEYRCRDCERHFQHLIMKKDEEAGLACPGCGGRNLKKLISKVAYLTSEQQRLNAFDPNARHSGSFYRDSRNIGLHAKKRAQQMGVDLGSGFEEKLERLRTDPGSVIKDSE